MTKPKCDSAFAPAFFILILIFISSFFFRPIPAKSADDFLGDTFSVEKMDSKEPWNLRADKVKLDQPSKVIQAEGNVVLTHGENRLTAEFARYHWDIKWIYLKGSVMAKWGEDVLHAREAEFDLQNQVGWVKDGDVFIAEGHLYVKGDRLEKEGPRTYSFEDAVVTSCDGETPDWSLKTSEGDITIDGYARLKHPRFRIKDRPVLYFPYLFFPVKRSRQSGFLIPEQRSSSREGFGFNLPYFYVINEEHDLTLYSQFMSKRGMMLGLEYRLTPDLQTKGLVHFDWLYDEERFETENEAFDQFDDDGLIRPNRNRYWLRGKFDGYVYDPSWKVKMDVDYVSDQDYLREFDNGRCGFDQYRQEFLHEFGRDINNKDKLLRENVFSLQREFGNYKFQGRLVYNEHLAYMNENRDPDLNPALQELPELSLDVYQNQLFQTPLEWEMQNEYTNFYRRYGDTGNRLDLHPRISWPLEFYGISLIPKVGWRETFYYIGHYQQEYEEDKEDFLRRGLMDFDVNAFAQGWRIYELDDTLQQPTEENLGESKWSKIRHRISPQVEYSYIPDTDNQFLRHYHGVDVTQEERLPSFDGVDRLKGENELTYSITNILTRRRDKVINTAAQNGTNFQMDKDYLDFFKLKLEQSYDFNEASRDENLEEYPRRPFSDIYSSLTLKPLNWLELQSKIWVSPYLGCITEHEHMLKFNYKDRIDAFVGLDYLKDLDDDIHRKNQEKLNILRAGGSFNFLDHWTLQAEYQHDLKEDEFIKQKYGVTYKEQCWSLGLLFTREQDEDMVSVHVTLYKLGGFEQSFDPGTQSDSE